MAVAWTQTAIAATGAASPGRAAGRTAGLTAGSRWSPTECGPASTEERFLFNRVYAPIAERASPTSQARRRPDIYFFFVSPLFALAFSFNRFS